MAQSDTDDLISLIEDDGAISEIPTSLPLLPVRDVVVFCDMVLPLFVGRDRSIRAVEEGVARDGFLMLATQKDPAVEDPSADDIYAVGTISRAAWRRAASAIGNDATSTSTSSARASRGSATS